MTVLRFKAIGKKCLNFILMAGHAGNFRIIDKGRKLTKRTNRKNTRYMPIQLDFEILYLL